MEIPDLPFEIITMDFITDLPTSKGYDSILVCTDKCTKTIILSPCNKDADALKTADMLMNNVFRYYGTPKKIISDRGPQFASQVMKTIAEGMGIRMALSTAYHPQTDGATERVNQELEQYLRAYCNRNQNNWADLLPYAEISHNTRIHLATRQVPFETLHGFLPHWATITKTNPDVPAAHQRLQMMEHARKEASAATHIANEMMKRSHDRSGITKPFQPGDQVWLDGKNLRLQYPSAKLAPKRFGPFPIEQTIGHGSYRITLPKTWKIHPVFHGSLLLPYRETLEHGANFTRPPPDVIDAEEEYEVEAIIDAKLDKRFKKGEQLRYFVKWKGYPDSENEWIPLQNLLHSHDLIDEYHMKHPNKPKPPKLTMAFTRIFAKQPTSLMRSIAMAVEPRKHRPSTNMDNHRRI